MNHITQEIQAHQIQARQNKDWVDIPAAHFADHAEAQWGHYGTLKYNYLSTSNNYTNTFQVHLFLRLDSQAAFDFVCDKELARASDTYEVITAIQEGNYSTPTDFDQVLLCTISGKLQGVSYKLHLKMHYKLSEEDEQTLRNLGKITTEWNTPHSYAASSYNAVHCSN